MTIRQPTGELLREAVELRHEGDRDTGAQTIAPDHSGRGGYRERELPKRTCVQSAVSVDVQRRVEDFLFYQSELLDGKHWGAYIDLFSADGLYWMPVTADQADWLDSPSIFAEDKWMMEVRMGRITHANAWSQAPTWETSHLVGNVIVESQTEEAITIRSRFQMIELRRETTRHFAGTYRHVLQRAGDDFKIRLQRVDLMNSQAVFDYVLQAWV
jgi:3-phenylpropionate/cinnamic acid dioxygenase small subunit